DPAPPAPETPEQKAERIKEAQSRMIYDMAFNVCAFQYWSYCSGAKQSTDLDKEELLIAVESSKAAAEKMKQTLIRQYRITPKSVETISDSAQNRIYKELNSMASNRDRHEKGVGKRDDMQQRCEFIARQWGTKSPKKLVEGGGGEGGGKGKSAAAPNAEAAARAAAAKRLTPMAEKGKTTAIPQRTPNPLPTPCRNCEEFVTMHYYCLFTIT
ncbi:MAG: hypothetical protein K2Q01_07105, partial [Rickettsiales bacterium]|nr:hypothetical protein [Rickettsiales bacterium]